MCKESGTKDDEIFRWTLEDPESLLSVNCNFKSHCFFSGDLYFKLLTFKHMEIRHGDLWNHYTFSRNVTVA